ncbi:hypothetical protein BX600DRAFT_281404 [Xylariales sp. PMI_506]|nr:hypothetical protein BX600DRAFT_281404 [Xylariales sp. PMI_506]
MANLRAMELASKVLDLSARSIDLLSIVSRLSQATEPTAVIAKEVGRWLGKEGLDEDELDHLFGKSRSLVTTNEQDNVVEFFQAVVSRRAEPSVVPLWAQPQGSLGRIISRDPTQRWITSTVCCLFEYHDEQFVKSFMSTFLMLASRRGQPPISQHLLERDPEKLRLDMVVKKIVESTWLNICNAGILGSAEECPKLPAELGWACKDGHNVPGYQLAQLLNKILEAEDEIIIQSEQLLTNLVLWLLWHHSGRLRIVVSGNIVYDRALGSTPVTVECRVARTCTEESQCAHKFEGQDPRFDVFEKISGNLHSILRGRYDTAETIRQESWVRQKLYETPFRYPRGQASIHSTTRTTARLLLRWFIDRRVKTESINVGSKLSFRLLWASEDRSSDSSSLKVGHLLGRTPQILNEQCAELNRPYVVFSGGSSGGNDTTRQGMGSKYDNPSTIPENDDNVSGDGNDDDLQARVNELLDYFPILQDLVTDMRRTCACHWCSENRASALFHHDENCFAFKAVMEVMFYFSHGIADAFGAPDVSGTTKTTTEDFGAVDILHEAVYWNLFNSEDREGTVSWHTLLSTAARVFLGCRPLREMSDGYRPDGGVEVHTSFAGYVKPTIIAVQYGSLSVVAPWLDITQRLSCRGCFRFQVVQGRIALQSGEVNGQPVLRGLPGDMCVVETQQTEDVFDFRESDPLTPLKAGARVRVEVDTSPETCDWVLVSADQTLHKLLMRVQSGQHSRMVEPSRALLQLSRKIDAPRCEHVIGHEAEVTEGSAVELASFEQLVGRWRATEPNDDETDEAESADGVDSEEPTSESARGSEDRPPQSKRRKTDVDDAPMLIRASHLMGTFFKFNTALALTGDDPVIISDGQTCLDCALRFALRTTAQDDREDTCRWLVHRSRDAVRTTPKYILPERRKGVANKAIQQD